MSFPGTPKSIGCATLAVAFLAFASAFAESGPRTDFSGTWKLNVAMSTFAPLPPLKFLVDKIEQTESSLKIHQSQANEVRERTNEIVFKLDGIEVVTKHTTGESHTLARWDGSSLIIESSLEFEGLPMQVRDRWSLIHDGRSIEIVRHFESHQGAIDQKLILDRQ